MVKSLLFSVKPVAVCPAGTVGVASGSGVRLGGVVSSGASVASGS